MRQRNSGCSDWPRPRCWWSLTMAQPSLVRWQVGIVVVFATVIELVFSGWLGIYSTDSVQCRVCARRTRDWSISRRSISGQWGWARRHQRQLVRLTVLVVVLVAAYALAGDRHDAPRRLLGGLLAPDSCDGAARRCCSSGAFWVVSWLEVLGTRWAGGRGSHGHHRGMGPDGQTRRRWQPAGYG